VTVIARNRLLSSGFSQLMQEPVNFGAIALSFTADHFVQFCTANAHCSPSVIKPPVGPL